jgi:hypothetical protein
MPTRLRIKAVSLFLSVNWGANLVIGLLTLLAIDGLGGVSSHMDDEETADAQKKGRYAVPVLTHSLPSLSINQSINQSVD